MVGVRISELDEILSADADDVLAIVTDVGGGSLATKKIKIQHIGGSIAFTATKTIVVDVTGYNVALSVANGIYAMPVPEELDGYRITDAQAALLVASTSGIPTIQVRKLTADVDILSTPITIDANERTSYTAATPSVVNPSYNLLATGDWLYFDCDVAGTDAKGLYVILTAEQ